MPTHAVIRYEVTDEEAYGRYRQLAGPSVKLHGGTFVTKGRVHEHLEGGDHLDHVALIEFPTPEAVAVWFNSSEYTAAREARAGAGEMTITTMTD